MVLAFRHKCDERCVCPVDGKGLYYWPKGGLHACSDPDCENAHGIEDREWASQIVVGGRRVGSKLRGPTPDLVIYDEAQPLKEEQR